MQCRLSQGAGNIFHGGLVPLLAWCGISKDCDWRSTEEFTLCVLQRWMTESERDRLVLKKPSGTRLDQCERI